MLALRLSPAIEKRLAILAKRTGRTKSFYARKVLLEHMEDMEDLHLAEAALKRVRAGKERVYPAEEVWRRLGLDD